MRTREVVINNINEVICKYYNELSILNNSTILITGATGLIGYNFVMFLIEAKQKYSINIDICIIVRNLQKCKVMYGAELDNLTVYEGDIQNVVIEDKKIDYVIHAASTTSSQAFVNEPISTIKTSVIGTLNILELALRNKVKSMIYLSTMEIYGFPNSDEKIDEKHGSNLNTMDVRCSYPESKRMCENLCASYAHEYGLDIKVLRLSQTIGPGIEYYDKRIFAEFGRCIIEGKDITLHTKGDTRRSYLHTIDAVTAILRVLLYGKKGEAYNVTNTETYCSILDMAQLVVKEVAKNSIGIKFDIDESKQLCYAPVLKMNLDTTKILELGWKPIHDLKDMFENLIEGMKTDLKVM